MRSSGPMLSRGHFPEETIDHLPIGIILVTQSGVVLRTNTEARRILRERSCLYLSNGFLNAAVQSQQRALRSFIEGAARNPHKLEPEAIALGRRYGSGKLFLLATTTRSRAASEPTALVFVKDPTAVFSGSCSMVQKVFNLSERQSVLAVLLARGYTLHEAARTMGITQNTIRAHLRHVFIKLDVRKQAHVVRLLLSNALLLESDSVSRRTKLSVAGMRGQ